MINFKEGRLKLLEGILVGKMGYPLCFKEELLKAHKVTIHANPYNNKILYIQGIKENINKKLFSLTLKLDLNILDTVIIKLCDSQLSSQSWSYINEDLLKSDFLILEEIFLHELGFAPKKFSTNKAVWKFKWGVFEVFSENKSFSCAAYMRKL